ncbi:alpha-L-fucosidase [Maritalea sp.]|uniref:alpha-L-fucosidase n=1 Tax=Maritalea sp. TaxID=2003361 RepID=UPI003EF7AA72
MDQALPTQKFSDTNDGKAWFTSDRFGMFIHFGLYALGARHEWLKHREEITTQDYAKYFENFDPDLYDPQEWARAAREAGMKYVVLTAKHHEGFCLWDSKFTDYKVTNTPYGKDMLGPYVDALRAEGLRVGGSIFSANAQDATVNLSLQMWGSETDAALWQSLADLVTKEHPNITVTPEISGWTDYWTS